MNRMNESIFCEFFVDFHGSCYERFLAKFKNPIFLLQHPISPNNVLWNFKLYFVVVQAQLIPKVELNLKIFTAHLRVEDLKNLKSFEQIFFGHNHTQLLRPQGLWISRKIKITPPHCMKNSSNLTQFNFRN
jgi:hypothetical protein